VGPRRRASGGQDAPSLAGRYPGRDHERFPAKLDPELVYSGELVTRTGGYHFASAPLEGWRTSSFGLDTRSPSAKLPPVPTTSPNHEEVVMAARTEAARRWFVAFLSLVGVFAFARPASGQG